MADFNDYSNSGLGDTGFSGGKAPVAPEDDFFHSLYISGKSRKNHIGVVENSGKLQVRGVEYNLDRVCMIISHVKTILVKEEEINKKTSMVCSSFQTGAWPWYGSKKDESGKPRMCGKNSAERAAVPFCSTCKSQIIVSGIYCDEKGIPKKNQEGKSPVFTFIRAKGMKYSGVSEYLAECAKLELEPIFKPVTEESTKFEKGVVNNKRFVTEVSIGKASSNYGDKEVFNLERGIELGEAVVLKVLEMSKKTLDKFNEKFDWSKQSGSGASSAGYADEHKFEDTPPSTQSTPPPETKKEEVKATADAFSFEDITF